MAKASPQQHAYNGGELSPLINGRQDLEKYALSLAKCENWIPLVQGAITRRPGSSYLKTTKFGNVREARLLPFEFSVDDAFCLEFGHNYIRVFTEDGIVTQAAKTISGITKADPGVVTATSHGYSDGDRIHLADIGGMEQLNGVEIIVANKTTHTFELTDIYGNDIDTSGYDTYTSGGTASEIFEVTTTYTETEVADIQYAQSADVIYIFHPDHISRKLTRVSALDWDLDDLDLLDGPYFGLNTTTTTLDPDGLTGSVTVTASSTTGINFDTGFQSSDVGRLIRWNDGTNWSWMEITAVNSTTSVDVTIRGDDLGNHTASASWRLGLYSETTGFPRAGTFHESRLFLGGAELALQRLNGSKTSDFENFEPTEADGTVADDNAVSFFLSSGTINSIQWMRSHDRGLIVGTSGSEWLVRAAQQNESITPSSINAREVSAYGSEALQPVRVEDALLFTQRGARKFREMAYIFEADGFRAPDMTVLAEHITEGGITQIALQMQPQPIIWMVRNDGTLLGLSYSRGENVVGWHKHVLGGVGTSTGGQVVVESVAVIPSPSDDYEGDHVFIIAKRYINGRTERYVELLTTIWDVDTEQEDAFHVDCGLTFSTAGVDEIGGLIHLEGEEVQIWADGTVHPPLTVTNGKLELDSTYDIITVGYSMSSEAITLPVEAGAADGSAQHKTKRINRLGLSLVDTLGIKIGPDSDSLTEILFRLWGQDWGTATPMFTGSVRERFEGDYDRLGQVYMVADTPAPATVLSHTLQVTTQDDS